MPESCSELLSRLLGSGTDVGSSADVADVEPRTGTIRYPPDGRGIGQVWYAGGWQWAVIRPPARGRPRADLRGKWIASGVFVPWHRGSGRLGLGVPLPLSNREKDAIAAAYQIRSPRTGRSSAGGPSWLRRRKGRPLRWGDELNLRLVSEVEAIRKELVSVEAALRRLVKQQTFGAVTASTLRRRYRTALSKLATAGAESDD